MMKPRTPETQIQPRPSLCRSSSAAKPGECSAERLRWLSSPIPKACSTLRRSSPPVECASERFWSSCCPEPHFQPIPEPDRKKTNKQTNDQNQGQKSDDTVYEVRSRKREGTNLGGEVFEDGGEVDRRSGADALGVAAFLEEPSDSAYGELEAGLLRPRHCLGGLPGLASASLGARGGGFHGVDLKVLGFLELLLKDWERLWRDEMAF